MNADSLNSNFLQLGRRSGGRPQRTVHPMRLPVNSVIHTTLVGLEPATFRSLVGCWSDALLVVPPTMDLYILAPGRTTDRAAVRTEADRLRLTAVFYAAMSCYCRRYTANF